MQIQKSGGSIIQTASIYGLLFSDKRIYEGWFSLGRQISNPAVYSTSKAAVIQLAVLSPLTQVAAGIRVNALVPAGVESGRIMKRSKPNTQPVFRFARMAQADEMVGAVIYLASDASSYVTGHCLVVDGGLSAW